MTERVLTLYLGGGGGDDGDVNLFADPDDGSSPLSPQPQQQRRLATTPYYSIEQGGSLSAAAGKSLDNPDQRIAEVVPPTTAHSHHKFVFATDLHTFQQQPIPPCIATAL